MLINSFKEWRPDLTFAEIKYQTVKDFFNFLSKTNCKNKNKALAPGTVRLRVGYFKTYLDEMQRQEKIVASPGRLLRIPKAKTEKRWWTLDMVNELKNLHLPDKLDKSRDRFLFQCYTGIRRSDLLSLCPTHIEDVDGELWLEYIPTKTKDSTGRRVRVNLAKLFNGEPERLVKKHYTDYAPTLFGGINKDWYNKSHLKSIGEAMGLDYNLTSHVGRHTCAMVLLNEIKLDMRFISGLLGHANTSITEEVYAHLEFATLNDRIAERFKR